MKTVTHKFILFALLVALLAGAVMASGLSISTQVFNSNHIALEADDIVIVDDIDM